MQPQETPTPQPQIAPEQGTYKTLNKMLERKIEDLSSSSYVDIALLANGDEDFTWSSYMLINLRM
ncbi:MAG: hypothetical protein K6F57_04615 [Candidatus Saccharibacteria bacterium]|nr:hypothetical protein [Candidatus Saccharibacteria bacterium]